jgi:hypothetical protein
MIRKYLAPSALILAFGLSLAAAQVVTKSVQLSQDPTGAIGLDAANNAYFPNKLLATRTVAPALTSCGTAPSVVTGNDTLGKFTTGSAATTCTLTFNVAYNVAPACILAPNGNLNFPTYTTSTTALTVTVDVASTTYSYICMSQG